MNVIFHILNKRRGEKSYKRGKLYGVLSNLQKGGSL